MTIFMSNRMSVIELQMFVGVYYNQVSLLLSIWEHDLFMDMLSQIDWASISLEVCVCTLACHVRESLKNEDYGYITSFIRM